MPRVWVWSNDVNLRKVVLAAIAEQPAHVNDVVGGQDVLFDERFCADGSERCVIVDAVSFGIKAIDSVGEIVRRDASLPVIGLVPPGDVALAVQLMRVGAFEVLQQPPSVEELGDAVIRAWSSAAQHANGSSISGKMLSPDERRLLRLTVAGLKNREIAQELDISLRTVCIRRAALMRKLGVRSRAELIRMAVQSPTS